MNLKALALSALTLTTAVVTTAQPAHANSFQNHVQLSEYLKLIGVTFKINPSECDRVKAYGWYHAKSANYRELVVCQENKIAGSSQQVTWTSEDLDTLRHEAHHVVQDCRDNKFNGYLHAVYDSPRTLAKNHLGYDYMNHIADVYSDSGEHTILMEWEAFSVASMNDPQEQIRDIQRYCM